MDRLRDVEVFLAIVSEGSLAGAGKRLSMSPPAVTRALARLEDRLGTALFVRSTRSLLLTSAGEAYLPRARDAVDAMAAADAAASDGQTLRGTLTLTAPRQLGRIVVGPIVTRFLEAHPHVSARLHLEDNLAHLLEEGIDLGIRIGQLPDATIIARKAGFVRQHLVASPEYLKKFGHPLALDALPGHRLIAFTGRLRNGRLPVAGGTAPFDPFHIEVNCAATALDIAERSIGLAPLWSYQCAPSITAGRLIPVLNEHMPPPSPCHFVWPERRYENPLVRAFADFARPFVQQHLEAAAEAALFPAHSPATS